MDDYDEKALKRLLNLCRQDENGCIIFEGSLDKKGYGEIHYKGGKIHATRLIMHLKKGFDLNLKLLVLHKNFICKSKACINDEHLYVGTQRENSKDAIEMGWKPYGNSQGQHNKSKTTCGICNFPLGGDNLRLKGRERVCKNCDRRRSQEYYQRKKSGK